jgi:hypothetical protein
MRTNLIAFVRRHAGLLAMLSATAGVVAAWSAVAMPLENGSPTRNLTSGERGGLPLEISPDPISLGTLDPGQSAIAKLTLRNSGPHPVIVSRAQTGCPCLNVAGQTAYIGPGQAVNLTVEFDPTEDPDFRGRLSIDVFGRDQPGKIVFQTHVRLEVRDQLGKPADRLRVGPVSYLERGAP